MCSSQLRQEFENKGYCRLGTVVSQEMLNDIHQELSKLSIADYQSGSYGILLHNVYQEMPTLQRILPKLSIIAMDLLNVDSITLFQDNLIWKPPHTQHRIAWHQDYSYWPLSAASGVTFWLALDDTSPINGCLDMMMGTHRLGEWAPTDFTSKIQKSLPSPLPTPDWNRYLDQVQSISMKAGEMSAHHPLIGHGSGENNSSFHRRGWSLTWITKDVKWDTEHAPHPYPLFNPVKNDTHPWGKDFPMFNRNQ